MKFEKVNQQILKRALKRDDTLRWYDDGDFIVIGMEANVGLWRVHKNDWYIDMRSFESADFGRVIKMSVNTKLIDTGERRVHPTDKKCIVVVFETEIGERVYVQQKFLETFDASTTICGNGSKSPIYLYEGDELVGCILPINPKFFEAKE